MLGDFAIKLNEAFAKKFTDQLKLVVPQDTGNLKNTISYKVDEYGILITTMKYMDFVDQGVNGKKISYGSQFSFKNKKPPIDSIKGWAQRKGLNPWAVRETIFQKGIRPRNFVDNLINDNLDGYGVAIMDAYWESFLGEIPVKL